MMRLIKKILKVFGGLLLVGLFTFGILYIIYNEPLPKGETGPTADALAHKMLRALNHEAYQNTRYLEWSFPNGPHDYKWDKIRNRVEVTWDGHTIDLNLNDIARSEVNHENGELTAKEARELYHTAWDYFNNDSFWLVAPFKVFDTGTQRSIVILEDGSEALLVTYTQGGSTPGDSYLWQLNANGFPESFRMWVKIIPIGGLKATWDDWRVTTSGTFLPTTHEIGPFTLSMGDVRAYN